MLIYTWIGIEFCLIGMEVTNNYMIRLKLAIYQDGGYADLILVPNYKYLIKLEDKDFNSYVTLACLE